MISLFLYLLTLIIINPEVLVFQIIWRYLSLMMSSNSPIPVGHFFTGLSSSGDASPFCIPSRPVLPSLLTSIFKKTVVRPQTVLHCLPLCSFVIFVVKALDSQSAKTFTFPGVIITSILLYNGPELLSSALTLVIHLHWFVFFLPLLVQGFRLGHFSATCPRLPHS